LISDTVIGFADKPGEHASLADAVITDMGYLANAVSDQVR
jgi:hypothetical protein